MRFSNLSLICTAAVLSAASSIALAYPSNRDVPSADSPSFSQSGTLQSGFRFSSSNSAAPGAVGQSPYLNATPGASAPGFEQQNARPLVRVPASEFDRDFYGYR